MGLRSVKGSYTGFKISCPQGDVPDYWFAANESVMHRVFGSALESLGRGVWQPKTCGVLHGYLAGLLMHFRFAHGLPFGRYKYHSFDSDFWRVGMWDAPRRAFFNRSAPSGRDDAGGRRAVWEGQSEDPSAPINYSYALKEEMPSSVCSAGPRWCAQGCPIDGAAVQADGAMRPPTAMPEGVPHMLCRGK